MLTRSQVARRLGKSLATVRRIEGTLLHPIADGNGVFRFRAEEVDALAKRVSSGAVSLWAAMQRVDEDEEPAQASNELLVRRWRAAEARAARLHRQNVALTAFAVQLCFSEDFRTQVVGAIESAKNGVAGRRSP